jgi:hypothetical protein
MVSSSDDASRSKAVNDFIVEIESMQSSDHVDYMDAILCYCEKHNLEIETVAKFVRNNAILKAKVQEEAENLNILEKTCRLPYDD